MGAWKEVEARTTRIVRNWRGSDFPLLPRKHWSTFLRPRRKQIDDPRRHPEAAREAFVVLVVVFGACIFGIPLNRGDYIG